MVSAVSTLVLVGIGPGPVIPCACSFIFGGNCGDKKQEARGAVRLSQGPKYISGVLAAIIYHKSLVPPTGPSACPLVRLKISLSTKPVSVVSPLAVPLNSLKFLSQEFVFPFLFECILIEPFLPHSRLVVEHSVTASFPTHYTTFHTAACLKMAITQTIRNRLTRPSAWVLPKEDSCIAPEEVWSNKG